MRRSLLKAFLPLLLLGAAPLAHADAESDWEATSVANYMAKRLKLYEDAIEHTSNIGDEDARKIAKSEIYVVWAKTLSGKSARAKRKEALKVLDGAKSPKARTALARLKVDFLIEEGYPADRIDEVRLLPSKDPRTKDGSIDLIKKGELDRERAKSIWWDLYLVKEELKKAAFTNDDLYFENDWLTGLIDVYYQMLRCSFVQIKMMPNVTLQDEENRNEIAREMSRVFNEMIFEQEVGGFFPVVYFDCYYQMGDTERELGQASRAIGRYIDIYDIMSGYPSSIPTVGDQAMRSVIRTVDVYLNDFGNDPKSFQKARDLIKAAFARYASHRNSAKGRELRLLDIQASLKLGDDPNKALPILLEMARDKSSERFQRRAASVLGDIAQLKQLTTAQRMECVEAILDVRDAQSNKVAIMVIHAVLDGIKNAKEYEAYGPFCYFSLGQIYEGEHRFFEAATVYLEASKRFIYLRDSNPGWAEEATASKRLPAHFYNAKGEAFLFDKPIGSDRISLASQHDAYNFSAKLAKRAADYVGYLISKEYGAPNFSGFDRLSRKVDSWNARFLGIEKQYIDANKQGTDAFDENKLKSAYVMMNAMPAYLDAQRNVFYAGVAFAEFANIAGKSASPTGWSEFGQDLIKESLVSQGEFQLRGLERVDKRVVFQSHLERVATDFAGLPASVQNLIRKDIEATNTFVVSGAQGSKERAWALSMYCFRRSFYFVAQKDSGTIGSDNLDISSDGFMGDVVAAWGRRVSGKTPSSTKMLDVADLFNKLSIQMKGSPASDEDRSKLIRDGLDASYARLGGSLYKTFKRSLENVIARAEEEEFAENADAQRDAVNAKILMKNFMLANFDHYIAQGNGSKAYETMLLYSETYYKDATSAKKASEGRAVYSLVSRLWNHMLKTQSPKAESLRTASQRVESHSFRLSKGSLGTQKLRALQEKNSDLTLTQEHKALLEGMREYLLKSNFDGDNPELGVKLGSFHMRKTLADFDARRAAFVSAFDALVAKYRGVQQERLLAEIKSWASEPDIEEGRDAIAAAQAQVKAGKIYEAYEGFLEATKTKEFAVRNLASKFRTILSYYGDGVGFAFRDEVSSILRDMRKGYRAEAAALFEETLRVRKAFDEFAKFSSVSSKGPKDKGLQAKYGGYAYFVADVQDRPEWWDRSYGHWRKHFAEVNADGKIPDRAFVDVNTAEKTITDDSGLAEEIGIRYHLGVSAMRVWQNNGFDMKSEAYRDASDNLRRVFNILNWRTSISKDMKDKAWFNNTKGSQTLRKIDAMIMDITVTYKTFGDLHIANNLKADWSPYRYYNQGIAGGKWVVSKEDAETLDEEIRFHQLPTTPEEWVEDSSFRIFSLANAFGKEGGIFNAYYRDFFSRFVEVSFEKFEHGGFGDKTSATAIKRFGENVIHRGEPNLQFIELCTTDAQRDFLKNTAKRINEAAEMLPSGNAKRQNWAKAYADFLKKAK